MSGIAGILYLNGDPVDAKKLYSMTDVVAHRGPDGIGHWVQDQVGLSQLQLCTTPESLNEQQPLVSEDGNYVIVWDGRIDNREELIRDLPHVYQVSSAATDVDIALHAYIAWGQACAKHIVGDFAFAVWDSVRQQLFCARDPVGIRQFHYYFDGQVFIFGTEIKQLFHHQGVPRQLNEVMLGLYLCGNFGDGEMTFYQGIKRLLGGYSLVVRKEGLRTQPFWDPDPYDVITFPREKDYAERFRELFQEAVKCRLRSNGGAEVLLSGGVDSGSVASVAGDLRRNTGENGSAPVSAQSWVYSNPTLDESPYVRLISDRYDIPITWLQVDQFWAMKTAPSEDFFDEPYKLPLEAMHCAGLESVRERGIRVVLTGEGGDETSMLRSMVYLQEWMRQLHWGDVFRDLRDGTPSYRRVALQSLRRSVVPNWARRLAGRGRVSIPRWISPEFARRIQLTERLHLLEPRSRKDGLFLQQRGRNPLFLGGDIRCAGYGVEWRHPFYDSRIIEFLVRIPPGIRFRGGRNKVLLREAMAGILPEEIRRRSPHGAFGPMLERGVTIEEAPRMLDLSGRSCLAEMGAVTSCHLKQAAHAYVAGGDTGLGRLAWSFFSEEWLRRTWPKLRQDGVGVVAGVNS